jgi:hypothetical protein
VNETDVLVYTNERKEEEFLVLLLEDTKPVRLAQIEGPSLQTPAVLHPEVQTD